jgi:hypothetical protein
MAFGVPAAQAVNCPRCKVLRSYANVDGGVTFRCKGCEWYWTLGTQAPTGVTNSTTVAGAVAISVASGGASFTNGMILLWDTGTSAEVVTVNGTASGVSIPITAAIKGHTSGAAFGQLLASPTYGGQDMDAVPAAPGWGF